MVSFPRKITPNSLLKVALLLSMAYGSLWYIVDRPPIITWMGYDKESSRFGYIRVQCRSFPYVSFEPGYYMKSESEPDGPLGCVTATNTVWFGQSMLIKIFVPSSKTPWKAGISCWYLDSTFDSILDGIASTLGAESSFTSWDTVVWSSEIPPLVQAPDKAASVSLADTVVPEIRFFSISRL